MPSGFQLRQRAPRSRSHIGAIMPMETGLAAIFQTTKKIFTSIISYALILRCSVEYISVSAFPELIKIDGMDRLPAQRRSLEILTSL